MWCFVAKMIDLNQAYLQLQIDEKSKELMTGYTPKRIFKVTHWYYQFTCYCRQKIINFIRIEGIAIFNDDI